MAGDPTDQHGFDIRLGWGPDALAPMSQAVDCTVVVDVLSFTTAVDVAVGRGATVFPLPWKDERAAARAKELGATLAADRAGGPGRWSLSPTSLADIPSGTRLALASPNGATVSATVAGHSRAVLAGCLRNATAVARAVLAEPGPVAVVASGERWPDGRLRVAVEDLVGAGAIISALVDAGRGRPSPEARAAAAAFAAMADDLEGALLDSISGRELVARGFAGDVHLAAALDVSAAVPRLTEGAFAASGS